MDHRFPVGRGNLHRSMGLAGGGPADQERNLSVFASHLARHMHHLIEGRGDETAQPDHVNLGVPGGLEDLLARHHDPQIDHLVIIAAEDDPDDVLADVMHIPLDGGQENFPLAMDAA